MINPGSNTLAERVKNFLKTSSVTLASIYTLVYMTTKHESKLLPPLFSSKQIPASQTNNSLMPSSNGGTWVGSRWVGKLRGSSDAKSIGFVVSLIGAFPLRFTDYRRFPTLWTRRSKINLTHWGKKAKEYARWWSCWVTTLLAGFNFLRRWNYPGKINLWKIPTCDCLAESPPKLEVNGSSITQGRCAPRYETYFFDFS